MKKNLIKSLALSLVAFSALAFNVASPASIKAEAATKSESKLPAPLVIPCTVTKTFYGVDVVPEQIYYDKVDSKGNKYSGFLKAVKLPRIPDGVREVTYTGLLYLENPLVDLY